MSDATWWWILAGAFVALEMVTGTFYLLMLATGLVAGALAAHAGLPLVGQIVAAAAVASVAVVAWHRRRQSRPVDAATSRDVHLDVGETVEVAEWRADGTASVRYRGAQWTAVLSPGHTPRPGLHRVAELVGNRLVLAPA